jgi:hypothetical protein
VSARPNIDFDRRTTMSISHRSVGVALVSLVAGCASRAESEGPEPVGSVDSALASEMTNGDASIGYAFKQYTTNPDIAVSQWSTVSYVNNQGKYCNGVMIGPNVMFSASHCAAATSATATFRTYRNLTTTSDTETFQCSYMIQTYIDTDGLLYDCAPNAAGQNPGDKYGYADFDVSTPAVGQAIYSVSSNPNQNGSIAYDARMYATGKITSTNGNQWFVPDHNPNTGITMDLWGEGGMSGSPHFKGGPRRSSWRDVRGHNLAFGR